MGDWQELALGIGLFCAGLVALFVLIVTTRIRRLPLQRTQRTTLPRRAIPGPDRQVLDLPAGRLAALGFRYSRSDLSRRMVALKDKDRVFSDVYQHADGTLASVTVAETPDYGEPCMVMFITAFRDGTFFATMNRFLHTSIAMPPEYRTFDDCLPDFESAWRAHAQRVQSSGREVELDAEVARARNDQGVDGFFDGWLKRGIVVPAQAPERYRLAWLASLRLAVSVLKGSGRAARARPKVAASPTEATGSGHEALEKQYATEKSIQWSKEDKHWITWVSVVAFGLLGVWIWDWVFMLILLAVIAVHEGGHYLAMRLVGYKNLHVFFVPGLGGLATGVKADASPLQKVFVFLAGPMPGIAMSVAAIIAFSDSGTDLPSWAIQLGIVTLAINYLNLLPVTPLDGGRVTEILLFAKVPLLRLLFAAACALALVGAGFYLGDWVLRIIGFLVLFSVPHQWRVYRLEKNLAPRSRGLTEAEAKAAVFEAASRPEFAGWSFANRSAAAVALVDEVQSRKPRWGESIAGLAIYAACLIVPIVAMAELTPFAETARLLVRLPDSNPASPDPSAMHPPSRDWKAEIARSASQSPETRHALFLEALRAGYPGEDPSDATRLAQDAWTIASAFPAGDPRRAETLIQMAWVEPREAERTRLLAQAEQELSGAQGRDRLLLARIYDQRVWLEFENDPAAAERALRQAFAIRAELLAPGDAQVIVTRRELARRVYNRGGRSEAGDLLKANVDALAAQDLDSRASAEVDYASYLAATGKAGEAVARLEGLAAQLRARPRVPGMFLAEWIGRELVWARMAQGTPEAAARALATLDAMEEQSGRESMLKRATHHQLDRVAAARAAGNAKSAEKAEERVRQLMKTRGSVACQAFAPADRSPSPWTATRSNAHAQILATLGICPAKPG